MIPTDWLPTYRAEDLELIGYLAPAVGPTPSGPGAADGADGAGTVDPVVPMSLLGTPLGEPMTVFAAEQVLEENGLSYLAERWLLRHDEGPMQGREQEVVVVEVTPAEVVVAGADVAQVVDAGRVGEQVRLRLPTDRLRLRDR